jgi:glycine oxidase ThiO
MTQTSEILVIGGGAIGLAIAVDLAGQGASVTVLSRDFAQAALHAAAGMLAPQAEALPSGPLLELCCRSRQLYPDWTAKLEALTGLDTGYWPCGILAPLWSSDSDRYPQDFVDGSQWLDHTNLLQKQPGLNPALAGGWWFPADGQVDNRLLANVLRAAALELGVNLLEGIEVLSIQQHQGRIAKIVTAQGNWQAQTYILATGAWTQALLPVPVVPCKGQILSVRVPAHDPQPLRQVIYGEQVYLVPRREGQIIVGGTIEDVGFAANNTPAGVRSLLDAAIALYPALADYPIQELWWGFRPATPDESPILGFGPAENLVLATGHYRNGILLAPITATLTTALVLKGEADPRLADFSWQRFANLA